MSTVKSGIFTVHDSVIVDFGALEIKIAAQMGANLRKQMDEWMEQAMKAVAIPPGLLDSPRPRTTNRQRFLENINKLRKSKNG